MHSGAGGRGGSYFAWSIALVVIVAPACDPTFSSFPNPAVALDAGASNPDGSTRPDAGGSPCGERRCGVLDDGTSCGSCGTCELCSTEGVCFDAADAGAAGDRCSALGLECGTDPCGFICGQCPACTACVANRCQPAPPACDRRNCGDDGCGHECGQCGNNSTCVENQGESGAEAQCVCSEAQCGPTDPLCAESCAGTISYENSGDALCDGYPASAVTAGSCRLADGGTTGALCGNGVCETGETPENCCRDCGCDGGICALAPPTDGGQPGLRACRPGCGDGVCEDGGEDCTSCPSDCSCPGATCVAGTCEDACFVSQQGTLTVDATDCVSAGASGTTATVYVQEEWGQPPCDVCAHQEDHLCDGSLFRTGPLQTTLNGLSATLPYRVTVVVTGSVSLCNACDVQLAACAESTWDACSDACP